MKSSLLLLLSALFFYTPSYALESLDLAQAWMDARFIGCDPNFVDVINIKNVMALNVARKGACAEANFKDLSDEKTIACFKHLNPALQIFLDKAQIKLSDYGCKENPQFAEYMNGDKKAIKAKDDPVSVSISCTGSSENEGKFKLVGDNGKNVCSRKYDCKWKFRFGENEVGPGTYYLRCKVGAKNQSECDEMNLYTCAGQEYSYAKVYEAFGKNLHINDSTSVKASKAPAAQ